MKYLGIINTMVIMEAESKKEAMKQLEKQCGQLQLDSKDGQILCSKASGHIVKVNVANTLTSHTEPEQLKKGNFFRCEHQIRILDAESN